MLSGRRFPAAEALACGLVHHVCDPEKIEEVLSGVVADLMAGGPEAIRRVKRLLAAVQRHGGGAEDLAWTTAREIAAARASDEGQAGTKAFLEKRPPPWAP
jgi:enoyl-CoA hydratase/carnithine racemase